MPKIIAIFPSYNEAITASNTLLTHNLADYSLNELSYDYESQVRQELFLSSRESKAIAMMIVLCLLIGIGLFYWLTLSPLTGTLFSWLLGGGLPVALFTGGGLGAAIGMLLTGLYVLSKPLNIDYTGKWLFILYCRDNAQWTEAKAIIEASQGSVM